VQLRVVDKIALFEFDVAGGSTNMDVPNALAEPHTYESRAYQPTPGSLEDELRSLTLLASILSAGWARET
jgi:hypothetical protein